MKLAEATPASGREACVVVNLGEEDARTPVARYFASFRWEPPAIDPAIITASAFLAMLDDDPHSPPRTSTEPQEQRNEHD